jgi:phospholipase C
VDRLNRYGVSWKDYFVDVPATAVIFEIPKNNPQNMAPISEFFADCRAGTLPAVSFVDSEIGVLNVVGSELANQIPIGNGVSNYSAAQDQDEENPADIQLGESFVQSVVDAVTASPAWPRTLLIWTYDEHGGYYDHVPPARAIPPDAIKPVLGAHDYPGGYDVYGPRVPAVVASPYSKPHGVSDTVCDHTSVLATIEAKWNLPACTYRDANANTVASFLDSKPALLEPPVLADSGSLGPGETDCDTSDPKLKVLPVARTPALTVRFLGRTRGHPGIAVLLHARGAPLEHLEVELLRRGRVLAHARAGHVGGRPVHVVLHVRRRLADGVYTVLVRRGGHALVRRTVHLR